MKLGRAFVDILGVEGGVRGVVDPIPHYLCQALEGRESENARVRGDIFAGRGKQIAAVLV